MNRDLFFQELWDDFIKIAPQAAAIKQRLEQFGETVVNDHVAFRTFDRGPLRLDALEPLLLALGYQAFDDYRFEDKHLRARAYRCEGAPRIFLSELLLDELSAPARAVLERCIGQIDSKAATQASVFRAGRLWAPLAFAEYEALADESEYAGWLAALGMHANHFTVSVNALKKLTTLPSLLDFVEGAGYKLNTAGGRIKGTPEVLLVQGSTLADRVQAQFADGNHGIPSCYYEFALRYPAADGRLYDGFVPASADKIFESTHR
ncbi:MAG TPA: DUF1338 domain-containing protein [Polyangiaceae bacterium]|jgi:hypothetical protein|nr:DUF1338 domain-containing protein [Polyangiaceae bacterium]